MLLNYHGLSSVGVVTLTVQPLGQTTLIIMFGLENCRIKNLLIGPHVSEFLVNSIFVSYCLYTTFNLQKKWHGRQLHQMVKCEMGFCTNGVR